MMHLITALCFFICKAAIKLQFLLILNIKYNGYRRAVIRGYGYGYSQMADFKFIDDNTFSIAYSYYEYCDEYDLRNQYDYELSEDQINEYDEYYVKVDFEGTYKRVTE